MVTTVRVRPGIFGRFIVLHPESSFLGWSGSKWVPVSLDNMPTGDVQVSNFTTAEEAIAYAEGFGFEVEEIVRGI
jgi:hypothetical protein